MLKRLPILFLLPFIFIHIVSAQNIEKLNFVGKIQCVNPNNGKIKAEYTLLKTSSTLRTSFESLAQFFENIDKKYWLTQTKIGSCNINDRLNIFIDKPVDILVLIKTLVDIFHFKYTVNANLPYTPSYILINQTDLKLDNFLNFLVQEYLYRKNTRLSVTFNLENRELVIVEKTVKPKLTTVAVTKCISKVENYVDLLTNGTYKRYVLLSTTEGIKLIPYIPCKGESKGKHLEVRIKCPNKAPVGKLYADSVDLTTTLKLFEKLFHIHFSYSADELSQIKHSKNIHLFLACLDRKKALTFLRSNFHLYLEKIAEDTYRIFKSRDSYTLLLNQVAGYQTKVLYLQNISANRFANILELKYGNKVIYTVDPLFNAITVTAPVKIVRDILDKYKVYIRQQHSFDRLVTKIFYVKYGSISDITSKIREYLSDKGFVKAINEAGAIEITDYPTNIAMVEKVFGRFLSQKPIKIKVTAKFVRISKTFARSLGISWDFTYGSNSGAESVASWQVTQQQGSLTSQFQFLYKKFNPINLTIGAGETLGLSKVLSSPSLVLLPNQPGSISFGTQIPYQSVDQNGNPKTELVSATLTLNVTPQLLPDGRILLKLNLSNNAPNTALAVNGQPAIDTFTISQNFIVSNGDTIIIGGVLEKKKEEGESGVPILRKIPLLGWLFKNKNWSNSDSELYVVISAQIVTQ